MPIARARRVLLRTIGSHMPALRRGAHRGNEGIIMTKAFRASPDVIIRTSKFDEATRFYTQVLGLEVAHSTATLVGLDAGAFRLYLEPGPDHGPVFDFRVPDFRAAKQALLAAGCALVEEDPAVPKCYLRDPFGLVFNIEQSPLIA
jgi:predicted enzyme related to lactoylglutathione lyase